MSNDPYGENYDICFKDGDFASKSSFAAWNKRWEPENTSHEWVPESRKNDGTGCLRIIHSARPSTASHISQVIHLVKNARYKFSGYIKFVEITSTTANGNGGAYCTLGDAYIGKYTVQDLPYSADWTYFESFYTAQILYLAPILAEWHRQRIQPGCLLHNDEGMDWHRWSITIYEHNVRSAGFEHSDP